MLGIVQGILNKTDTIVGLMEFINYQKVKYTEQCNCDS